MIDINIPERITASSLSRLQNIIAAQHSDKELIVDFGPQRHFSPRSILLLFRTLETQFEGRKKGLIKLKNASQHTYLQHVGLFNKLGIDDREYKIDATTHNYLPLHSISIEGWLQDLGYDELASHIDQKSRKLTDIICRDLPADESNLVHFNLREIIRNTFEHAEASRIDIIAQYWPKLRKAEIAIHDNGHGIRSTISRNTVLPVSNDLEAIKASILPGVSGSSRGRTGSDWDNSGFGLYMTSEISRLYGSFSIGSGTKIYELRGNSQIEGNLEIGGTFVSMEFQLDNKARASTLLSEIAARGEREAKRRFGKKSGTASKSSKSI